MTPINENDFITLNKIYHGELSSFHMIYGATKSGKTSFIRDFLIKKNFLYLTCTPAINRLQYSNFVTHINKKFKLKNHTALYDSFDKVLELIKEQDISEKLIIIFDDFHELLKYDKDAFSILLEYWKKYLQYKNIQLIVSSSSTFSTALTKKIEKESDTTFFMEKFKFDNIKNKSNITTADKFYIYAFLGTSTYILAHYNTKEEFIKNIYNITLRPNSPFFYYGFDYLKKDLSEIGTFCSILYAIAIGNHKLGDIANFLKLKSTYLTRYMQKLQELFIIRKELPLSKKQTYSKYGRYYINDNFLKFWFCYIYPNITNLEIKKHQPILKELDDSIITNILTPAYIDYMRELIANDPEKYLKFTPLKIGSWWDNHGNTIDIVAYDNQQITFIKVLWENQDIATLKYGDLKQMSDKFKTTLKRNYIIITKNTYLNNF